MYRVKRLRILRLWINEGKWKIRYFANQTTVLYYQIIIAPEHLLGLSQGQVFSEAFRDSSTVGPQKLFKLTKYLNEVNSDTPSNLDLTKNHFRIYLFYLRVSERLKILTRVSYEYELLVKSIRIIRNILTNKSPGLKLRISLNFLNLPRFKSAFVKCDWFFSKTHSQICCGKPRFYWNSFRIGGTSRPYWMTWRMLTCVP